jgi:predicted aspartyl protease
MRTTGANGVGRFKVEFEITSFEDLALARRGQLPPEQVRREKVSGWVDKGAPMLVLPQAVVKRLGLPLGDKITVRYADGRRAERPKAKGAWVEILGRGGTFDPLVEPKRQEALIGAIVLEGLDLLVDCQNQCLVPRDPSVPVYEIE